MFGFGLTNSNVLPIGLDIGNGWLNMVQLRRDNSIAVVAADKVRVDDESSTETGARREVIISGIKQMLERNRFTGNKVVTSFPNDKLNVTSLRLAQMNDEQTDQAVKQEAKERFGLDSDEDVIRHLFVGQVKQGEDIKNELVLFAAAGSDIREHLQILEDADLVPVGLDAIPCALFRSFDYSMRREEDRQQTMVFVDVGKCFTTIVFGRGGEIAFVKQIPVGTGKFDLQISDKLGVTQTEAGILRAGIRTGQDQRQNADDSTPVGTAVAVQSGVDVSTRQVVVDTVDRLAQDLAREISLCLRYYTVTFRGKRVERAVFSGGGAYENILMNVMRRQLPVEIQTAEPFRGFDMANVHFESDRRSKLSEWAVAVGLALKAPAST